MPFYDFRCNVCGNTLPVFRKVDQRNIEEYHCAEAMTRVISAPSIRPEITPYVSPASGKLISSRVQRNEDLKREGCIENEPGLRQYLEKRKVELADKAFAPIAHHIDQTASALHAAGHI